MMSRFGLSVLCLALLSACQASLTTSGSTRVGSTPAANTVSAKPSSAPANNAVLVANKLKAPAGANLRLSGSISIDPSYLVAKGGGSVVSASGANVALFGQSGTGVVGHDGASVIGHDGASVVGHDGASVVGHDGASVVGHDGASVVGHDGASVVGHDGASVIGHDGASFDASGNLVARSGSLLGDTAAHLADDGSSFLSAGGNALSLTSAKLHLAAVSSVAPSTILPAAGMLVSVVDMNTHQYLSLGQDANGQPVFSVYSNAKGGYEVYLPSGTDTSNVLVVASAPGSSDGRLAYNLITRGGQQAQDVTETSALVTRYIRTVYARRFGRLLLQHVSGTACAQALTDPAFVTFGALTGNLAQRVDQAAAAAHLSEHADTRAALIAYMDDNLLAPLDLNTLAVDGSNVHYTPLAGETVRSAITQLLTDLSTQASARLAADPASLSKWATEVALAVNANNQAHLTDACATYGDIPASALTITSSTELGVFIVNQLLADGDPYRSPFVARAFEIAAGRPNAILPNGEFTKESTEMGQLRTHLEDSDTSQRPAIGTYHRLVAASNGLIEGMVTQVIDPRRQCGLLNTIQPGFCPAPTP
jgi:hypothetical protein